MKYQTIFSEGVLVRVVIRRPLQYAWTNVNRTWRFCDL